MTSKDGAVQRPGRWIRVTAIVCAILCVGFLVAALSVGFDAPPPSAVATEMPSAADRAAEQERSSTALWLGLAAVCCFFVAASAGIGAAMIAADSDSSDRSA